MTTYYPPFSFYYTVGITDVSSSGDSSFSEVSGLEAERGIVEIKEGGENRFTHRLPDRAKYGNLTLMRGVLLPTSQLATWCKGIFESDLGVAITVKNIDVSLLNGAGAVLMTWNFVNAWPVKWGVSKLVADKNELAIESLEFAYSYFTKAPA
jgi:phage tail-like protein